MFILHARYVVLYLEIGFGIFGKNLLFGGNFLSESFFSSSDALFPFTFSVDISSFLMYLTLNF